MGYCKRNKEGIIKSQEVRKSNDADVGRNLCEKHQRKIYKCSKSIWKNFLGRVPKVDESVLGLVDQLHVWEELEAEPSIVEIDDAIRKLNFTAAGHDGITAGMWKALARDDEIFLIGWYNT